MPEVPDTVDDAIEPLSSPSTNDVFEATRPFSAREIASAAASEALSGGGGTALLKAVVDFTHDDIISADMVGAGFEVVPAPGENKLMIGPGTGHGFCLIEADTTAGVYTNLHDYLRWNLYLSGTADGFAWDGADDVLSFGAPNVHPLVPFGMYSSGTAFVKVNGLAPGGFSSSVNDDAPADLFNKPLIFALINQGNGPLTGGDPANTLRLTILYWVLDIS